ncbi:rhodanese-like domain-containing protein [Constantimarinum furrinae]|uniref:Rhodanese n=1 Tax=Constantimarinum furrinae TaxID=2562285 RepID=A0A7G8PS01_9FLAO|nr:rhodanese-like domain-containing protein [Constantimarinum furrinae]QNJ97117.1 rhodanese [Constantimarinum furrinae]
MKAAFTLICFFFTVLCLGQTELDDMLQRYNTRSIPYISVEELRMLQTNESIIVLDAREKNEFEVSKIPSALYIGYSEFSSEGLSEKKIDKSTPIIVYCSLGIRSEVIGEKLKKEGYLNVKNLYGGIFEWKNNGYPVFDSQNVETENVHVCSKIWGKWLQNGTKVF